MKKKDIDFLIFWETKVREIESIILLGEYLKMKGYKVDYFAFSDMSLYFKSRKYFNRVKVAVMPSLYHDEEIAKIVYRTVGKCDKIVNLRWEQVYQNKDQKNYNCYSYPKNNAKKCYHCCWGIESFNEMEASGIDKKYLRVTGPMHMDFLNDNFDTYYLSKMDLLEEFKIKNNKKICLFTSSFSAANMTDEQIYADGSQPGADLQALLEMRDFHKKSRDLMLEWIKDFLLKYPDICFIYRPHPVENADDLKSLESKYTNFKVISKYNVKQWILKSDYVFTWVSTSIAEAFFARKNCFIVRPIPFEFKEDMIIYNGAEFITTEDKFLEIPEKENEITLDENVLKSYYDIESTYAFKRTANFLIDIINDGEIFDWNKIDISMVKYYTAMKSVVRFFYRRLVKYIPAFCQKVKNAKINYTRDKNNFLSRKEFSQLCTKLKEYV